MTRFAEIRPDQLRTDCRYYSGYKPCGKHDGCPDCPEFRPRGAEILVIKLAAMGDVLRTKCLLPSLKAAFPDSWITWLTARGSEAIVRDPRVDEIVTFDFAGLNRIEGRRWDLVLCLDKDAEALALSRRVDAKERRGYAPTPHNTLTIWNPGSLHALRLGLSDELKYRTSTLTHPEILHLMAELPYQRRAFDLTVPAEATAAADALIERLRLPARPIIGINTGCGPAFETKAWSVEGFRALLPMLARESDASLLLLGGPRERDLHADLMRSAGDLAGVRVFDAGNDNPLEVFFGLVGRCNVIATSDSLAMHVAVALRRRVVAWFGPTCHQEVDLYDRGERLVTDYACAPCYRKRCDVRPSCMQALSADRVARAILEQLAAGDV